MKPCCPKCGSDDGYVTRARAVLVQIRDFDTGEIFDTEISGSEKGKLKHCFRCGKNITTYIDSLNQVLT